MDLLPKGELVPRRPGRFALRWTCRELPWFSAECPTSPMSGRIWKRPPWRRDCPGRNCPPWKKSAPYSGKKVAVPCTGCRYCCDDCPQELDIPSLLSAYNDYRDDAAALGDRAMAVWRLLRLKALPEQKQPGACTAHCPQMLEIPEYMKEMAEQLRQ